MLTDKYSMDVKHNHYSSASNGYIDSLRTLLSDFNNDNRILVRRCLSLSSHHMFFYTILSDFIFPLLNFIYFYSCLHFPCGSIKIIISYHKILLLLLISLDLELGNLFVSHKPII